MARKVKKTSPPQYTPDEAEGQRRLLRLREKADYRVFFEQHYGQLPGGEFLKRLFYQFGVNTLGLAMLGFGGKKLSRLLDPSVTLGSTDDIPPGVFANMFCTPSIQDVTYVVMSDHPPYERTLLVDLRADKTTLLKAFSSYLDDADRAKRQYPDQCSEWWPGQTRKKRQSNRDSKIWAHHCKGMTFAAIGRKLGIPVGTVKTAFYKRYEEEEGKPFNRGTFRRKYLKKER